jgi:hypothetical protein
MMNEPIGDTTFGSSITKCFENSLTKPVKEALGGGVMVNAK